MPRTNGTGRRPQERGAVLIEFAFVLPLLLLLTFLAVDLGRAFHYQNMLTAAARQGARTFAVTPLASDGTPDQTTIEAAVRSVFNPTGSGSGVITSIVPTGPTGSDPLNRQVTVTVTSNFNWLFPGLLRLTGARVTNPMSLSASCTMRYERTP